MSSTFPRHFVPLLLALALAVGCRAKPAASGLLEQATDSPRVTVRLTLHTLEALLRTKMQLDQLVREQTGQLTVQELLKNVLAIVGSEDFLSRPMAEGEIATFLRSRFTWAFATNSLLLTMAREDATSCGIGIGRANEWTAVGDLSLAIDKSFAEDGSIHSVTLSHPTLEGAAPKVIRRLASFDWSFLNYSSEEARRFVVFTSCEPAALVGVAANGVSMLVSAVGSLGGNRP